MRWAYLIIDKHRSLTNIVGTIIVAWMASVIVSEAIALFLPSNSTSFDQSIHSGDETPSLLSGPQFRNVAYYLPICERNIFDSQKRASCHSEATDIIPEPEEGDLSAEPVKSDISATLLGTMVSTRPHKSFATISVSGSKESENYYVEEMILDEARIYEIQRNRVFFVRKGRREYIEVERLPSVYAKKIQSSTPSASKGSGVRRDGDRIVVTRAKVEATLGDLNKVVQQARMVPNFKGGNVNGFKIFGIRRGSIFDDLGLKNGDVIQRINGTTIDSVEKAIPMLQLARSESSITIDLSRRGQKKSLSVEIQ